MIEFKNPCRGIPYLYFEDKYNKAKAAGQKNIEAISIASYNNKTREVDSRFVNLKFIDDKKFIFFSNLKSPKSIAFRSHNQISALLYWSSINVQIRMKAKINQTSIEYNRTYFQQRSLDKNALAISSKQSQEITSFDDVIQQYKLAKESKDLSLCPDYWGGFSFIPYYFEFWEGHESRLNKRIVFNRVNGNWKQYIIEP